MIYLKLAATYSEKFKSTTNKQQKLTYEFLSLHYMFLYFTKTQLSLSNKGDPYTTKSQVMSAINLFAKSRIDAKAKLDSHRAFIKSLQPRIPHSRINLLRQA